MYYCMWCACFNRSFLHGLMALFRSSPKSETWTTMNLKNFSSVPWMSTQRLRSPSSELPSRVCGTPTKAMLEVVTRNKKLEDLYGQVAHKAFEFCKRYRRRVEFKRLSESFRMNLNSIIRGMVMNPDYNKIPLCH